MRYPTDNNRITSQYGFRMINGALDFHGGTDYGALEPGKIGDKIYCIADNSKVVHVDYDQWRGYNIILEHNSHCTRYNHLEATLVSEGQTVHEKTVIGIMGSTGKSTGAHLHFEVHKCKYSEMFQKWPNGEAKHTIDPELFFLTYMRTQSDYSDIIGDIEQVLDKYRR